MTDTASPYMVVDRTVYILNNVCVYIGYCACAARVTVVVLCVCVCVCVCVCLQRFKKNAGCKRESRGTNAV